MLDNNIRVARIKSLILTGLSVEDAVDLITFEEQLDLLTKERTTKSSKKKSKKKTQHKVITIL